MILAANYTNPSKFFKISIVLFINKTLVNFFIDFNILIGYFIIFKSYGLVSKGLKYVDCELCPIPNCINRLYIVMIKMVAVIN